MSAAMCLLLTSRLAIRAIADLASVAAPRRFPLLRVARERQRQRQRALAPGADQPRAGGVDLADERAADRRHLDPQVRAGLGDRDRQLQAIAAERAGGGAV